MFNNLEKNHKTTVNVITNNLQSAGVKVSQSTIHRRLRQQNYKGYTARCKPLISTNNQKVRFEFVNKYRGEAVDFWNKVL